MRGATVGDEGFLASVKKLKWIPVRLLDPHESLFGQGDPSPRLYILLAGTLHASTQVRLQTVDRQAGGGSGLERGGDPLDEERGGRPTEMTVRCGDMVGALAFVSGSPHLSSVRAIGSMPAEVLAIDAPSLDRLLAEAPRLGCSLLLDVARGYREEMRVFERLGLQREWRGAGDLLFEEGAAVDNDVFLLISGRVKCFHHKKGELALSYEVGRGETVGDTAANRHLEADYRDTTALVTRDTELIRISSTSLEMLCRDYPAVTVRYMEKQAAMIKQQARASHQDHYKTGSVSTLAVIPLRGGLPGHHTGGVDQFTGGLIEALQTHGSVRFLTHSMLPVSLREATYDEEWDLSVLEDDYLSAKVAACLDDSPYYHIWTPNPRFHSLPPSYRSLPG